MKTIIGIIFLVVLIPLLIAAAIGFIGGIIILIGGFISAMFGNR